MFGLFKSKKKLEQERRARFFFQNCIDELRDYVSNHPEPTRDDLIKVSVNAKITNAIFCNVKELQSEAREALYPLVTNGLAVLITVDNMEEYAALQKMQAIVKNTFDQLVRKEESELTLPSIRAAFIMAELVSFT